MKGLVSCLVFWWSSSTSAGVVSHHPLDKSVIYHLVDDFIGFEMSHSLDSAGFVGCIYLALSNFRTTEVWHICPNSHLTNSWQDTFC